MTEGGPHRGAGSRLRRAPARRSNRSAPRRMIASTDDSRVVTDFARIPWQPKTARRCWSARHAQRPPVNANTMSQDPRTAMAESVCDPPLVAAPTVFRSADGTGGVPLRAKTRRAEGERGTGGERAPTDRRSRHAVRGEIPVSTGAADSNPASTDFTSVEARLTSYQQPRLHRLHVGGSTTDQRPATPPPPELESASVLLTHARQHIRQTTETEADSVYQLGPNSRRLAPHRFGVFGFSGVVCQSAESAAAESQPVPAGRVGTTSTNGRRCRSGRCGWPMIR